MSQVDEAPVGFWKVAPTRRDALGIVDPTGNELSFGRMYDMTNQMANTFAELGLKMGDTIAVVARNRVETMVVHLAAMQSGLYYTPINYHSVAGEIAYILKDSDSTLVVAHEDFVDTVRTAADEVGIAADRRIVLGSAAGFRSFDDVIATASTAPPAVRPAGQVLQYTSGTTGRPKGVRRKVSGVDADTAAESLKWVLGMYGINSKEAGCMLMTTPVYHTAGLNISTLALHFGITIVLMDNWTPEATLQLIEQYRTNMVVVVPTQFVRLLKLPAEVRAKYDVSSLNWVLHGAAPCSPEVKRQMIEWWGPIIYEYYGSTEVGGTFVNSQDWLKRPGTVGKPGPVTTLRILDDDGNELPPGEVGRVFMRQGDDQVEYLHDPEKTAKSRVRDLMTVGDIGWVDEDGWLYLAGRTSEVIIVGGVNIYPTEVENVLLSHPAISDACVVGIPNDEYGEEIYAAVTARDASIVDGTPAAEQLAKEVLAYCYEHIAKFKCPRTISFRTEIPRDPNGKMYRKKIRDPFWEGRERAI
jgi:long-chain acyl-CoA synthetase